MVLVLVTVKDFMKTTQVYLQSELKHLVKVCVFHISSKLLLSGKMLTKLQKNPDNIKSLIDKDRFIISKNLLLFACLIFCS